MHGTSTIEMEKTIANSSKRCDDKKKVSGCCSYKPNKIPSAGGDAATSPPPIKATPNPYDDIRYDGCNHWPSKVEKRGR